MATALIPYRYHRIPSRAVVRVRELATLLVGLPVVTSPTRARVLQSLLRHRTVGSRINPFVRIVGPGTLSLEPGCFVNSECFFDLTADVRLGERVHLGPRVSVYTSSHRMGGPTCRAGELVAAPVSIGAGTWIGANAVILPGVRIGDGIVVGAGAVVTRDLLEPGVYVGTPAAQLRGFDDLLKSCLAPSTPHGRTTTVAAAGAV